jgi:hypothetical protein
VLVSGATTTGVYNLLGLLKESKTLKYTPVWCIHDKCFSSFTLVTLHLGAFDGSPPQNHHPVARFILLCKTVCE